jgi:hypothetical protein
MTFHSRRVAADGFLASNEKSRDSANGMDPPLQTAPTIFPCVFFCSSTFQPGADPTDMTVTESGNVASIRTVGDCRSVGTDIVYFCVAPAVDSPGKMRTCPNTGKVRSTVSRNAQPILRSIRTFASLVRIRMATATLILGGLCRFPNSRKERLYSRRGETLRAVSDSEDGRGGA